MEEKQRLLTIAWHWIGTSLNCISWETLSGPAFQFESPDRNGTCQNFESQFEIKGKLDPRGTGERAESRNPQIPGIWLRESSEMFRNHAGQVVVGQNFFLIGYVKNLV